LTPPQLLWRHERASTKIGETPSRDADESCGRQRCSTPHWVGSDTRAIAAVTAAAFAATVVATVAPGAVQRATASAARQPKDPSPDARPRHVAKDRIVVAVVADFVGSTARSSSRAFWSSPVTATRKCCKHRPLSSGTRLPAMPSPGSCARLTVPDERLRDPVGGHYAYWPTGTEGGDGVRKRRTGEWKVSKGDVEGWRFEPDGARPQLTHHHGPRRALLRSRFRPTR